MSKLGRAIGASLALGFAVLGPSATIAARHPIERPAISYLTRLTPESESSMAVDHAGNTYVVGAVSGGAALTPRPLVFGTRGGRLDAYLAKLNPKGKIVFFTVLAGGGDDEAGSVTVDHSGNVFLAGSTTSTDFPISMGPLSAPQNGTDRPFLAELDGHTGRMVFSMYLGAVGQATPSAGGGIGLDSAGEVYVVGTAMPDAFPEAHQLNAWPSYSFDSLQGFIAKVPVGHEPLVHVAYLGGSLGGPDGLTVAVDLSGRSYVARYYDPFIARVSSALDRVISSRRLSLTEDDRFHELTQVAGLTTTKRGALYATGQDSGDVFAAKLDSSGKPLHVSWIGGQEGDWGYSVAVDGSGSVFVSGMTWSTDFPRKNPLRKKVESDTCNSDDYDVPCYAFLVKVDSKFHVVYSTFLFGGWSNAVGLDSKGTVFVAGGGNKGTTVARIR